METHHSWFLTHLQWTEMGPSWPNCSFVLWTWPMKSITLLQTLALSLWPVGELELPHGSGLPVLQNESHTPNHRGGRQEDSDSAQAIKAGMIFSKTGKKKLETCLTRKSVTFISYLLLTLSTFHIYLNCKLIYSHKMSS